jgi:hypothetical protein
MPLMDRARHVHCRRNEFTRNALPCGVAWDWVCEFDDVNARFANAAGYGTVCTVR